MTDDIDVTWLLECATQRAVVLFQAYARGVSEKHSRSEEQFIDDVNTFSRELRKAVAPLKEEAQRG